MAVTFDMLRAFDSLARTLNLSETAESLGTTRQTVRRHISNLEAFRGGPLFSLQKQSYFLTPLGTGSLPSAQSILRQAESWSHIAQNSPNRSQHLDYAKFINDEGRKFLSQQHPVSAVTRLGTPLVQSVLSAWGQSLAQIESDAMAKVRPHLVIYRRSNNGWVCVEVGDHSAYTKWFGWTWAKSAVGRLSEDDQAGNEFNRFIADAYERLHGEGGVRLDHLFAHLPREISEGPVPVTFQRLLMGCIFPDNTPALAVLVSVTSDVEIDGLGSLDTEGVSPDLINEFKIA
ncbi:MAG: LysR family transcriptional regulator [Paracoccaceae bacterium]